MALSPEEIAGRTFTTVLRGYRQEEVQAFLAAVAEEVRARDRALAARSGPAAEDVVAALAEAARAIQEARRQAEAEREAARRAVAEAEAQVAQARAALEALRARQAAVERALAEVREALERAGAVAEGWARVQAGAAEALERGAAWLEALRRPVEAGRVVAWPDRREAREV